MLFGNFGVISKEFIRWFLGLIYKLRKLFINFWIMECIFIYVFILILGILNLVFFNMVCILIKLVWLVFYDNGFIFILI